MVDGWGIGVNWFGEMVRGKGRNQKSEIRKEDSQLGAGRDFTYSMVNSGM
jgi:hypothetical protein